MLVGSPDTCHLSECTGGSGITYTIESLAWGIEFRITHCSTVILILHRSFTRYRHHRLGRAQCRADRSELLQVWDLQENWIVITTQITWKSSYHSFCFKGCRMTIGPLGKESSIPLQTVRLSILTFPNDYDQWTSPFWSEQAGLNGG